MDRSESRTLCNLFARQNCGKRTWQSVSHVHAIQEGPIVSQISPASCSGVPRIYSSIRFARGTELAFSFHHFQGLQNFECIACAMRAKSNQSHGKNGIDHHRGE